jgi:hypothetical protein
MPPKNTSVGPARSWQQAVVLRDDGTNCMGRSLVTKVACGRLSDPAGRNVSEA